MGCCFGKKKEVPVIMPQTPVLSQGVQAGPPCGCNHSSILSHTACGVDTKLDQVLSYIDHQIQNSAKSKEEAFIIQDAWLQQGKVRSIFADASDLYCMGDILDGSGEPAQNLLKNLSKMASLSLPGGDLITAASKTVLEGIGKAHWICASLLVVAFVLERMDLVDSNKTECLDLLNQMYRLGTYMRRLKQRPHLKQQMAATMEQSMELILKGAILCSSQRQSSWWSQFIGAKIDKRELENVGRQLDAIHKELMLEMVLRIYDSQHGFQFPRHRLFPTHAVGIEDRLKTVIRDLEMESYKNVVGVVLFGFGGIGKTVLADAVYASIHSEQYVFSKVSLYGNIQSKPSVTKIQKQMLDDISDTIFDEPRNHTDGQLSLLKIFQSKPCFIYIDNVLDQQELRKLLPNSNDLTSCSKLRLLMTARTSDVKDALFVSSSQDVKVFDVGSLVPDQAKDLLQKKFRQTKTKLKEEDMNFLVSICGGVPLCLELVGNFVANHLYKSVAMKVIREEHKRSRQDTFALQPVDFFSFAFDSLSEAYKDAFLDVCAFFMDMPWAFAQLLFGDDALEALQSRALLKMRHPQSSGKIAAVNGNEYIIMPEVHDVILAIAKKRYEANRITQVNQLRRLLLGFQQNPSLSQEQLRCIKGIRIEEDIEGEPLKLPAAALDVMSSSLRHFSTKSHVAGRPWGKEVISLQGMCSTDLSTLITWNSPKSELPFTMHQSHNLKWLKYAPRTAVDLSRMPRCLVHLDLRFRFMEDKTVFILGEQTDVMLPQLTSLTIHKSETLFQIPAGLLPWLKQLKSLSIVKCEKLSELSKELHELSNLYRLDIRLCPKLRGLPSNLKLLTSLKILLISRCEMFQLSDDFCDLSSLEILRIEHSRSIRRLPPNFGKMSSLKLLSLQGCETLSELAENFTELSSLQILDISECKKLGENWINEIWKMKSLKVIYIKGCSRLIRRWSDIAHNKPDLLWIF